MPWKYNLFTNQLDYIASGAVVHNDTTGKQGGIAGEYYHLSSAQHTSLTDAGDSALHYHSTDRDRVNHTGTQLAASISDFDAGVTANVSVAANTTHRGLTNNPHTVTHTQVGSATAQWNADKIQGVTVDDAAKADTFVLTYDNASGTIIYAAGGGGGGFDPDVEELAIGLNAVASGADSTAIGFNTDATGARSFAAGYGAQATNTGNVAIGDAANAAGTSGIAIGDATGASGAYGVAVGALADASSTFTAAYGWNAQATGLYSQAFGAKAAATSAFSLALGYDAQAKTGNYGTSLGNSSAAGNFGLAAGYGAIAGTSCTVIGAQVTSGSATQSTLVGRTCTAGAYGYQLVLGYGSTSNQVNTIAIGNAASVTGSHGIAIGRSAVASATHAVSLGYNAQGTTANQIVLGATGSHYSTKVSGCLYMYERTVLGNVTGYGQLNWRDNAGTKELWAIDSLGNATQLV